jgi:hypothetical protein
MSAIKWHYVQQGETFAVDDSGCIGRYSRMAGNRERNWLVNPSVQWRVVGAVRHNNFGAQVEYVPFPECMAIKGWRYANGKARWHLCDFDHGTHRVHGAAITDIWEQTT